MSPQSDSHRNIRHVYHMFSYHTALTGSINNGHVIQLTATHVLQMNCHILNPLCLSFFFLSLTACFLHFPIAKRETSMQARFSADNHSDALHAFPPAGRGGTGGAFISHLSAAFTHRQLLLSVTLSIYCWVDCFNLSSLFLTRIRGTPPTSGFLSQTRYSLLLLKRNMWMNQTRLVWSVFFFLFSPTSLSISSALLSAELADGKRKKTTTEQV